MRPVAVVSDTTHYLPRAVMEANGIHQVSLYVNRGERQDREADLADLDEYYERLRTAADLPTTSQPSLGDFLAVYEGARQAKEKLDEELGEERVAVLDSTTSCGGLGMVVLGAAAAARADGDRDAVLQRARQTREQLRIWFAIDTMEYLRRSGRVGAARAWLGSTLKIKPILTLESQITPVERVRTSGRALERMVEYMESLHENQADSWCVQHIQDPERAQRLVERGREIFGSDPLWVSEIGPVIGTHVGPGLLGVGGCPSRCFA